jgi:hypothetical protein
VERATGIEPVLPAWEGKYSTLYFQHLQNRPIKMCVHALHTVHALPDLRIVGGRLGDGFYHAYLFANAELRLTFCARSKAIFERSNRRNKLIRLEKPIYAAKTA